MTETTLIILIFCIGVPIIIVSVILILKGLKESNPLLPLLASIMSFCFLVFFLYSIKNYSEHQENQYVYYVLIDGNEYNKYNNAAIAEMMLNILPQMAEQIAKPLSQIKDINIYGGSVSDGVSQISGNSPAVIKQVFDTVSKATGVELSEVLKAETYAAKVDKNINAKIDTESIEKETAEII